MSDAGDEREWQVEPTVPLEKWVAHARKKLARGYMLIMSPTQRTANFFKPGVGYEMCAYQTAKQLVQTGIVVEVGSHYLGTIYQLAAVEAPSPSGPSLV